MMTQVVEDFYDDFSGDFCDDFSGDFCDDFSVNFVCDFFLVKGILFVRVFSLCMPPKLFFLVS